MKYLLMYWDHESEGAAEPAEQDAAFLADLRRWVDGLTEQGIRLDGGSLAWASQAKLVSVRDGETLVADGPFAETKEQVGGFDVIECPDMAAAVQVAAAHPLARTLQVEVRPLERLPWEEA
jgi:hypothetical protein